MERSKLLEDYRENLGIFCFCLAWLSTLTLQYKENHDESLLEDIKSLADSVKEGKEVVLEYKKLLGYEDGLSFLENNRFDGFEIKDGILLGYDSSKEQTMKNIVMPWILNGPEENNYLYEVGTYIEFMVFHTLIPYKEEEKVENMSKAKINILKEMGIWLKNVKKKIKERLKMTFLKVSFTK